MNPSQQTPFKPAWRPTMLGTLGASFLDYARTVIQPRITLAQEEGKISADEYAHLSFLVDKLG